MIKGGPNPQQQASIAKHLGVPPGGHIRCPGCPKQAHNHCVTVNRKLIDVRTGDLVAKVEQKEGRSVPKEFQEWYCEECAKRIKAKIVRQNARGNGHMVLQ